MASKAKYGREFSEVQIDIRRAYLQKIDKRDIA
jgi:hypothetical protein